MQVEADIVDPCRDCFRKCEPFRLCALSQLPQGGVEEGRRCKRCAPDRPQGLVVGSQRCGHTRGGAARAPVPALGAAARDVHRQHPGRQEAAATEQGSSDGCAVERGQPQSSLDAAEPSLGSEVMSGGWVACGAGVAVGGCDSHGGSSVLGRRDDTWRSFRLSRPVAGVVVIGPRARDLESLARVDPVRVVDLVLVGLVDPRPVGTVAVLLLRRSPTGCRHAPR